MDQGDGGGGVNRLVPDMYATLVLWWSLIFPQNKLIHDTMYLHLYLSMYLYLPKYKESALKWNKK